MTEGQSAIATKPANLGDLLKQEGYKGRFNAMLGARAPQFMSSILNVASASNFNGVEPRSILAAAAVAATLDLPIDKNLGFAWVVPYNTRDGKLAQFQIGWKGIVQLALRSGQYAGMNAFKVNREALGGYNEIGDPVILWENLDETKPAVGYAFAWKLINGFHKIVYWPKEKVEAHAQKYSQAYRSRGETPWKSNFDEMALKTLVKISLTKWGVMSVEMRQAAVLDQSAAIDIEATPVYVDNGGGEVRIAQEESPVNEKDDLESAPEAGSTPAPDDGRSRLEDAWTQCVEATTLKVAHKALESATGHRSTDKVPVGLIEVAIRALMDRANEPV